MERLPKQAIEYCDSVYGIVRLDDPVLLDLMNSAAMLRLQGVLQHGISGLIGITSATTRYEHSAGAMILVRRLGGDLDEQIAALLHDVSHTAFSHVIDYVFHSHISQSFHDEKKAEYIAGTDLPALLAKHGYDWRDFLEETRYPLLEQPAPALCADRLDYFLRDGRDLGLATDGEVAWSLGHMVVHDGRIAVNDLETARWLGYKFIAADEASWANFREVGIYELTAQAIRRALQIGVLVEADIWGEDRQAWDKMLAAGDRELQRQVALISPETKFIWDEANPDFRVSTKIRTIDPDVLLDGELWPLSRRDLEFERHRTAYLQRKRGKWPMRVEP